VKKLFVLFLSLLSLLSLFAGCTFATVQMPSYVVMLTQLYPSTINRCTGVLVDPTHVLTAAHCVDTVRRVITPDGQEGRVIDYQIAKHDMALLELDRIMWVSEYATLGKAHKGEAQIYGTCPYYWGHQARQAIYAGLWSAQLADGYWIDFRVWDTLGSDEVCGGDSGGVVIQNNKVVGITSMVESESWLSIGTRFYTVPAEVFKELE